MLGPKNIQQNILAFVFGKSFKYGDMGKSRLEKEV